MLVPTRAKQPEIRPPKPEVGIEFHRLAGIIKSFMPQSNIGKEIGSHEPPHLAQRVFFNHARQLKLGLDGAAGREQKECAIPLTQ